AEPFAVAGQQAVELTGVTARQSRCADVLEVMQRPDNAAGAMVKRRLAARSRIPVLPIERMDRPIIVLGEARLGVADDRFDGGLCVGLVPADGAQRLVSDGFEEHGSNHPRFWATSELWPPGSMKFAVRTAPDTSPPVNSIRLSTRSCAASSGSLASRSE